MNLISGAPSEGPMGDKRSLRLLFVEDNPDDLELALHALRKAGFEVTADCVESAEEFDERFRANRYDLVLSDYYLPHWTGLDVLDHVRRRDEDIPFILVTGTLGEETAVECIKRGVTDYVLKDGLIRLPVAVHRALEEKNLREERRQAEEAREALYRLSLQIQAPLDLKDRLDLLIETARTVFGLDRVNILLADSEGQWLDAVASAGTEEPVETIRVPIGPEGGGLAQAYLTRQPIFWDGDGPVPEAFRLKAPYDRIAAFRSRVFCNVPLVVHGRAIGVLGADSKHSRRSLEPATRELLQLFAAQAALAIDNARLFQETKHKAERLRVLNRLSRVVASALQPEQVIEAVVEAAVQLFEDSAVNFWLVDKDGETLSLQADHAPHFDLRAYTRVLMGQGFSGWIAREKKPLVIADILKDPRAMNVEWIRAKDFRAFMGVPLLLGEKCLGSLNVFRRSFKAFDQKDQDFLTAFADQAAVALENARLFEQVAQGKREWESTFDAIADGIVLLSEDGTVSRANHAFGSWWETPSDGLIGASWHDLWGRLGISAACPHCESRKKKAPVALEAHVPASNRFVGLAAFPLAAGEVVAASSVGGTILVIRDITERKRADEELRAAHLQLIQSAKLESVGRLAAGVAHEVKNPLAIIQQGVGYLSKTLVGPDDHTAAQVLQKMDHAVRKADRVIKGLLDFSVPSALEMTAEKLNEIVEESLLLVKHELIRAHVAVVKALGEDLPLLRLDRHKMEQVFVNFFMNAIQAMPGGGTLNVRTYTKRFTQRASAAGQLGDRFRAGETVVVVEVEDTGIGIPVDKLDRIFEPFFTMKGPGEGTGLGLSVTRKIIELHGGMLDIANREEGGVRVTLMLKAGGDTGDEETNPAH